MLMLGTQLHSFTDEFSNLTIAHQCRYKFYTLSKNLNKSLSADDLKEMASSVVVSALCIPLDPVKKVGTFLDPEMEDDVAKVKKIEQSV